jgi:uncharacterized damage-inducible protein DinB
MNAKAALQNSLQSTQQLVTWFISDLSDADLLVRPVPGANHIAWQLGHLIASEGRLGSVLPGAKYPELPAGFAEKHDQKNVSDDQGFGKKTDYGALFEKTRAATLENLNRLSDADLDKPTSGPMAKFAPTLGSLIVLVANHTMMHAGQFSVVRRKLGKPILF